MSALGSAARWRRGAAGGSGLSASAVGDSSPRHQTTAQGVPAHEKATRPTAAKLVTQETFGLNYTPFQSVPFYPPSYGRQRSLSCYFFVAGYLCILVLFPPHNHFIHSSFSSWTSYSTPHSGQRPLSGSPCNRYSQFIQTLKFSFFNCLPRRPSDNMRIITDIKIRHAFSAST